MSGPHVPLLSDEEHELAWIGEPDAGLVINDADRAYADGVVAGEAAEQHRQRHRDRLAVLAIAAAIAALVITAFWVGRASAAPRTAAAFDLGQGPALQARGQAPQSSGAPQASLNELVLPVDSTSGGLGSSPLGGAPLSHGRTGVIAYADESHGPGYLAIPIGPGHLVTICGPAACWTTVSTDAGPNHERLVAGRIADVAVGQWERICGFSRIHGTCIGSWRLAGAGPTPPATDVEAAP